MDPERPSSSGTRAGVGYFQGVEAPWHLVHTQKDTKNKYKSPEDTNIWGIKRAHEEGAQRTGAQETIDLICKYTQERQGPGRRSSSTGEWSALSQLRRKDRTNKG